MSGFRHAFSMTRKEVRDAVPPGTVFLSIHAQESAGRPHLKHNGELILSPQPSEDPADPLNWPSWRKFAVLLIMSLYAAIGNFTSGSIASVFPLYATPMAFNPPVSIGKLGHLIAVNVLMMGAANILWVPLANTFGRRPITLFNILLLMLCSVWAARATSFGSLLAARFFMGVGVAPADTIAPNVVGEIYFAHQRGKAMGFYTVFICIGPVVGGIAGGYIGGKLGLAWIHWVNVILSGILLVACLFVVPETLYTRKVATQPMDPVVGEDEKGEDGASSIKIEDVTHSRPTNGGYSEFSFIRSLKLYTYHGNLLQNFIAPWLTLRLPGVWLVMLWYAGLVGGVVTISTVAPTLAAQPPYLWGNNAGLILVGGIVGAILGAVATALSADRIVTTKKTLRGDDNMEPEARLPIALPGLILATTGLWTFGFCAQSSNPHMWIGMQFGLGMLSFGLMQAPSIGFNYIIDSYGSISADCFVAVTCMRAIISFSWTFFASEWVTSAGPAIPFGVFGGLMGLFTILTIPQWLWGKRTRIATAGWIP
ncbi:major facilitator superfamily domain-containing protein [Aspergillus bertholletiae]|uniref:Major facilitator superfamily domain-containing protein n=1 Tax=Aspergillus bertholletiae TaxID=1226010 RepID=A0A5N7BLJ6_9EURO|nr:major facilitator superfamily domain-containing protein [Aspergillus bertholletiae]